MISITTVIDVVGMVDDHTIMSWDLSNQYLGPGIVKSDEAVGSLVYRDSTMTNGGHLMMNKQFGFDSSDQRGGLNNLESTKLITYESIDGSHLFADEEISLSNVGNYSASDNPISCVFSASAQVIPAFCNTVTARSTLVNINSVQISTKADARMASDSSNTPAALLYRIDITPNPTSGLGYAVGSVLTEISASSMESRSNGADEWNRSSSHNFVSDKSFVTGGIIHFLKAYDYGSGIYPDL
ncbi:MAG: hypothetical protein LUQ50_03485 [Methanospirillum sp.]|uniref:hypothetical protein n=1 Tax=Methanospirillum sp. TaxID=45200 RepID=UPI0023704DB9|nr:hypothetical protein [Methanospirillum sp.]MDD1728115.1 hypothetical protein [Methanospirillum sp.]